jgi:hypothetical protein
MERQTQQGLTGGSSRAAGQFIPILIGWIMVQFCWSIDVLQKIMTHQWINRVSKYDPQQKTFNHQVWSQ